MIGFQNFPHWLNLLVVSSIAIVIGIAIGYSLDNWKLYAEAKQNDKVLAQVGQYSIKEQEFLAAYAHRNGKQVDNFDSEALLRELILQKAYLAAADSNDIRSKYKTQLGIERMLISQLKQNVLQPRLNKIQVSKLSIREYYLQNREMFIMPARFRFSMIMQRYPKDLADKDRENAEIELVNAIENISEKSGFGKNAASLSDHQPSRYKGGDIGWYEKEGMYNLPSQVLQTGFALNKPGQTSPPIWHANNLYFLKLTDLTAAAIKPIEEVSDKIHHQLITQARQQTKEEFEQEVIDSVNIAVFSERIPSMQNEVKTQPVFGH